MSEQLDAYNSVRKEWGINPVTRVKHSKKKYKRKKLNVNEILADPEEFDDEENE